MSTIRLTDRRIFVYAVWRGGRFEFMVFRNPVKTDVCAH